MSDIALEMDRVFKKFKRGQLHDSLRDLIPALAGRLVGRRREGELAQREFWAVRDVSFQVKRGEAFGVIGNNGAGKSTILKLLTGIMRPTRGTLAVNGRLSALIEVSAGFHPDLTGRENIYLNGTILGMSRQEITRRFDEIVAFSGLEDFIDTPVKRYSSGMYARLGFSVAAHVDPDILIVDEVLSVGDFVFQQKCMERMTNVIRGGATVVFVSHNLRAVSELCDRALLMDHGGAKTIGPTDDVVRAYLEQGEARRSQAMQAGAFVSRVDVRDGSGPRATFSSGERVLVDVEMTCRERFDSLAVILGFYDGKDYLAFHVSSESMLGRTVSLGPNESVTCTFALQLHLAPGKYRLSTWVRRCDIRQHVDHWASAATVFVSSDVDVGGVAHLYPTAQLGPTRAALPAGDASVALGSGAGTS